MARFVLVFSVLGLSACGDQALDPFGNAQTAALRDASRFGSLANAAFLQTVDGLNFGDSAYATRAERLLSERSCSTSQQLVEKTKASQWVNDDSPAWTARSNVTIDRTYESSWVQGGTQLSCGLGLIDFQTIDQASFRLQSRVLEKKKSSTLLTKKSDGSERTDELEVQMTGTRDLEITGYSEASATTALTATLRSDLDLTLALKDEFGEDASATMKLAPESRLDFEVTVDRSSSDWKEYRIPFSRQEYDLGGGNLLTLELSRLSFTPAGNCFPQSGSIRITRTIGGQVSGVFAADIDPKTELVLSDRESGETLSLTPFACVFRER